MLSTKHINNIKWNVSMPVHIEETVVCFEVLYQRNIGFRGKHKTRQRSFKRLG